MHLSLNKIPVGLVQRPTGMFYQLEKTIYIRELCSCPDTEEVIVRKVEGGERGVLKLENGIVTALISKEEAEAAEIETFVESKFGGSLPAFVAAFTKHQDLSDSDLDEVQKMIDRIRKGG